MLGLVAEALRAANVKGDDRASCSVVKVGEGGALVTAYREAVSLTGDYQARHSLLEVSMRSLTPSKESSPKLDIGWTGPSVCEQALAQVEMLKAPDLV
ncbi:hypothetical protein NXY56_004731 [Leishmania guyanensis]|nr:Putative tuzin (pseudogene) [Leishmania guyanensis]